MNFLKPELLTLPAVSVLILSAVSGCAVMSEDECRTADWHEQGYADGTNGKSSSLFEEYVSACQQYVFVDRSAYFRGRRDGAEVFCNPSKAYDMGLRGEELTDICNGTRNEHRFREKYERGYAVYDMDRQIREIDDALNEIDGYLRSGDFRGRIYDELSSDYRYLEQLRYSAESDYNRLRNSEGRSAHVRNYRSEMEKMPYYRSYTGARTVKENLQRANEELDRIRYDIDSVSRKMDRTESQSEFQKYKRERDCLRDEERKLRREIDRYLDSSNPEYYRSFSSDRHRCHR